jgi:hypothetical protein
MVRRMEHPWTELCNHALAGGSVLFALCAITPWVSTVISAVALVASLLATLLSIIVSIRRLRDDGHNRFIRGDID